MPLSDETHLPATVRARRALRPFRHEDPMTLRTAGLLLTLLAVPAELYMWLACERYRLVRKHIWDEDIIDELRTLAPRRRPWARRWTPPDGLGASPAST